MVSPSIEDQWIKTATKSLSHQNRRSFVDSANNQQAVSGEGGRGWREEGADSLIVHCDGHTGLEDGVERGRGERDSNVAHPLSLTISAVLSISISR